MQFIDTHCHLNAKDFDEDLETVISKAKSVGVKAAVIVSETIEDFERTIELSARYRNWIYPCLGLHPVQDSRCVTRHDLEHAVELIHKYSDKLVGIGEIGLDFSPWICKSPEDKLEQEYVFRTQIQLANSLNLPVNVHSRSAAKQVVQILIEEGCQTALLHNFAGRPAVAMTAASHGYCMSFPPLVITKPERDKLLKRIPLDAVCLETDSPALGVNLCERNEPCYITEPCKHIAKLKDIDVCQLSEQAWTNSLKLFNKIQL